MKLRVNLYQAALQPRHDKMTLPELIRATSLVLLLLLVGGGFAYQQLSTARAQFELAQTQQQHKVKELELYQQALSARQPSAQLQQQASVLKQSIAQKQQLLGYLQQENNKTPPQYAKVMQHLSDIDPKGLWLTGFALGGSEQFEGITKDAELVPRWLTALGAAPGLQGLEFSLVKLEPVAEGAYRQFLVSAKAKTTQHLTGLLQQPAAATPANTKAEPATSTPAAEAAQQLNQNASSGGQP
ncbi:PilN domain-containing protein [Rheinheimera sp. 4Y26]|uniref:PilN domain-containing protein n=1 Tax=Rheinheimera sp. 4Y26 TaxID=2977811 RepID=UPI0021B0B273|nr:PilN domain-containing protein [Rheinheimera sp. 4Y26]MCT6698316.1 PilN domain-containing protein [Rheinheimera sp. 4Y26]